MRFDFNAAEIDFLEKNISKKNLYGDTRNRVIASLYAKKAIVFYDCKTGEQINGTLKTPFDVLGGTIAFSPELIAYYRRTGSFN